MKARKIIEICEFLKPKREFKPRVKKSKVIRQEESKRGFKNHFLKKALTEKKSLKKPLNKLLKKPLREEKKLSKNPIRIKSKKVKLEI